MRHAYRKFLAVDLSRVSQGLDPHAFSEDSFLSLARVLRDKLRISVDRGSVTPLMHFIYETFEKSSARISSGKLACRKGCSHCCNIWTDAYAPEVFFVAKKLSRNDGSRETSAVSSTGEFSASVSFVQREALPIPCPLLVDNACSIYAARPLNCRTAVSLDEEACKKAFIESQEIEIPIPPAWGNLGQMYSMALKAALHHANLACEPYEWNSALKLAMEDTELEKLWLRGQNVLCGAPVARPVEPFTHPFWRNLYDRAFAG